MGETYKKAAENIASYRGNIYEGGEIDSHLLPDVTEEIEKFINNFIETNPEPLYTPDNPRRSARNVNKAKKFNYYSPEDEMMDVEDAIIAVCEKKGLTYSEDLVKEFYEYLETAHKYEAPLPKKASIWANSYSRSLQKQIRDKLIMTALDKYCTKNRIEYDSNSMMKKYDEWASDPANEELAFQILNGGPYRYAFPLAPSVCVRNFFKCMKKQIVY